MKEQWSAGAVVDTMILTELLYLAVRYGNAAQVDWLLRIGAHPEGEFTDEGFSPLYYTCLHREIDKERVEIARLLLDAGADVNRVTASRSNVAVAVRRGRKELVRLLLERGADPAHTMEDFDDGEHWPLENIAHQVSRPDISRMVREMLGKPSRGGSR